MRFLIVCANNFYSHTNGLCKSLLDMATSLQSLGHTVELIGATLDDEAPVESVNKDFKADYINISKLDGLDVTTVSTSRRNKLAVNDREHEFFTQVVRARLKSGVDALITYGNLPFEQNLFREAKREGCITCFYLVSDTYVGHDVFWNVDFAITDSEATLKKYKDDNVSVYRIAKFINRARVVADDKTAHYRYITYINPIPSKGCFLFQKIAERISLENPEIKFLVVDGRGSWQEACKVVGKDPLDFSNVMSIRNQSDMRYVYSHTKLLLVPSLWNESGARVVLEAALNGIPSICSNRGGLPELVNGIGVTVDTEFVDYKSMNQVFNESTIDQWCNAIKTSLNQNNYARLSAACSSFAEKYDFHEGARQLESLVKSHQKQQ